MENETYNQEEAQVEQPSSLHQVTPLSKYLALALFVILPFLGGWVGYMYAPEKIVEVERVVEVEKEVINETTTTTEEASSLQSYSNEEYGFSFMYPLGWKVSDELDYGLGYTPIVSIYNTDNPFVSNSDSGGDSVSISLLDNGEQSGGYRHGCFELVSSATLPIIEMFDWDEYEGMGDARQLCMQIGNDVLSVFLRSDNISATTNLQSEMDGIVETIKIKE